MSAPSNRAPFEPVMVTGANSGIGTAIVGALLERDVRVVATVRSDRSDRAVRGAHGASPLLKVARLDLLDPEQAGRVVRRHAPGTLVHNAGAVELGAVMDVDDEAARRQLEATVVGPARLTRAFVRRLRDDDRHGRLISISTMVAETDVPFTGWYGASKAAADVLSDALATELRPSGIDVARIQCGAVRTEIWDEAGGQVAAGADAATQSARRRWDRLTGLARPLFADPDDVGRVVAEAVVAERTRDVYRVGFASRLGIVSRLVPAAVEHAVASKVLGLREPSR